VNPVSVQLDGVVAVRIARPAELALAQSERTLRRITDSLPVLIAYIDTDERYRFVNAAYQRWFQRDTEALRGTRMADLVGADA
jgi:PAS domain-containing protein